MAMTSPGKSHRHKEMAFLALSPWQGQSKVWMNGWMDGWMDGWTYGIVRWMDRQKDGLDGWVVIWFVILLANYGKREVARNGFGLCSFVNCKQLWLWLWSWSPGLLKIALAWDGKICMKNPNLNCKVIKLGYNLLFFHGKIISNDVSLAIFVQIINFVRMYCNFNTAQLY